MHRIRNPGSAHGPRHYCDRREIDFDASLEGSLDVYLEEQGSADDESSEFDCQDF